MAGIFDRVSIAFYTGGKWRKRRVIKLEKYLIAALESVGVPAADVPAWIQQAVTSWPAFDPELPITGQVKYLIVRKLTEATL